MIIGYSLFSKYSTQNKIKLVQNEQFRLINNTIIFENTYTK